MTAAALSDHPALQPADEFALNCGLGVPLGLEFVAVVDQLKPWVERWAHQPKTKASMSLQCQASALRHFQTTRKAELRHFERMPKTVPRGKAAVET